MVIGGGIVGVFTAYYLARRGVKVALVEKGRIGAEQSSRNWGWCRQQNRDARELPMATEEPRPLGALRRGDRRETSASAAAGCSISANDEAEIAGWARWRDFARTVGVTTHMLSGGEATERGVRPASPGKAASSRPPTAPPIPRSAAPGRRPRR